MEVESIKLGLIDRLMKIKDEAALHKVNELLTQAEMEFRTEESLEAIKNGDSISIESFRKENEEWRKMNTK